MPIYVVLLLDILILYFSFGSQIQRLLQRPRQRRRTMLRDFEKHFKSRLRRTRICSPRSARRSCAA